MHQSEQSEGALPPVRLFFGLAIATMVTLSLELLFSRFVSLLFNSYEAYWVIGLALLGFGAGGGFVATGRIRVPEDVGALLSRLLVAIGITGLLPLFASRFLVFDKVAEMSPVQFYAVHFIVSISCMIPFFFASVLIAFCFMCYRRTINRLYFFDLVGSGIGCFLFLVLLWVVGVEIGFFVVAQIAVVGSLFFLRSLRRPRVIVTAILVLVLFLSSLAFRGVSPVLPCVPQVLRLMRDYQGDRMNVEYQKWDTVARIDIASIEDDLLYLPDTTRYKILTQDGDAPSILLGFDRPYEELVFPEKSILGIAYWTKLNPSVLVIGAGGGPDVAIALHFQPRKVVAVEMNGTSIQLVGDTFADFVGGMYQRPEVEVVHDEGRHFVRTTREKFDVIQLTGVDTYVLGSVGAIQNLTENYLYTMEALNDYYDHLSPDGILSFTYPNFSNWALRALAMSLHLLHERAVAEPEKHLVVSLSGGYCSILIKKSPFTPEETTEITSRFDEPLHSLLFPIGRRLWGSKMEPKPWTFYYQKEFIDKQQVYYNPYEASRNQYSLLIQHWPEALEYPIFSEQLLRGFDFPTDDHPFFFLPTFAGRKFATRLTWIFVMILVLILAPLILFRRRGLRVDGAIPLTLFFACIGFAYMAVEMTLLQKLVLFLGHPSFSFVAVLSTLLVASGIGSLLADRVGRTPSLAIVRAIGGIAIYTTLFILFTPMLIGSLLQASLPIRIAVVSLLIFPLGFLMGVPFPSGIRLLDNRAESFIPWAWGINGGCSVLGSVASLFLAIQFGFTTLLFMAAGIYLAAWLVSTRITGCRDPGVP